VESNPRRSHCKGFPPKNRYHPFRRCFDPPHKTFLPSSPPEAKPVSHEHCLSERSSPGNPKNWGASLSSQGLSLTPDTSRPSPVLSCSGGGKDAVPAP